MKNLVIVLIATIFVIGGTGIYFTKVKHKDSKNPVTLSEQSITSSTDDGKREADIQRENLPMVEPISHASLALQWGDETIYADPVGDLKVYSDLSEPELILITDTHGDHFNLDTLEGVVPGSIELIVPQAVYDKLSPRLAQRATVLENGETTNRLGIDVTAVAMYNIPESDEAYHKKGRGNGYILERDGVRVYIAGDTGGTPEMRSLKGITMAFIPMNVPFTMDVAEAVEATLAFAPEIAIPYHYRNREGYSDVQRYKELVESQDSAIDVQLLAWYPEAEILINEQ